MRPEAADAIPVMVAKLRAVDELMAREVDADRALDDETADHMVLAMASAHLSSATRLASSIVGTRGAAQLLRAVADALLFEGEP